MKIDDILPAKENVKGVVIDTNLLLLFLVGLFDKNRINTTKVTRKYSIEDFHKLIRIVSHYGREITVTPNIITEVCNHGDKLNTETDLKFFKSIEQFLINHTEYSEPSINTINQNKTCYYKLGITDTSIYNLATKKNLIITDDLPLYHFLTSNQLNAINYSHLVIM